MVLLINIVTIIICIFQSLVLDAWEKEQKELEEQGLWKLIYRWNRLIFLYVHYKKIEHRAMVIIVCKWQVTSAVLFAIPHGPFRGASLCVLLQKTVTFFAMHIKYPNILHIIVVVYKTSFIGTHWLNLFGQPNQL